ncbi:MAG: S-layer homology domain-containing protein, partial [Butyricicoccus sp.]
ICTRAQGAALLYRAAGSPVVSGSAAFTDVADSAYYADAVKWATEQGITKGISSSLFGPDATCTRAQIVTFLYRMYQGK